MEHCKVKGTAQRTEHTEHGIQSKLNITMNLHDVHSAAPHFTTLHSKHCIAGKHCACASVQCKTLCTVQLCIGKNCALCTIHCTLCNCALESTVHCAVCTPSSWFSQLQMETLHDLGPDAAQQIYHRHHHHHQQQKQQQQQQRQ